MRFVLDEKQGNSLRIQKNLAFSTPRGSGLARSIEIVKNFAFQYSAAPAEIVRVGKLDKSWRCDNSGLGPRTARSSKLVKKSAFQYHLASAEIVGVLISGKSSCMPTPTASRDLLGVLKFSKKP